MDPAYADLEQQPSRSLSITKAAPLLGLLVGGGMGYSKARKKLQELQDNLAQAKHFSQAGAEATERLFQRARRRMHLRHTLGGALTGSAIGFIPAILSDGLAGLGLTKSSSLHAGFVRRAGTIARQY